MSEDTARFGISRKVIGVILFAMAVVFMAFALEAKLTGLFLILAAIIVACLYKAKKIG